VEWIFGGTRDAYIAFQCSTAVVAPVAGLISGGLGVVITLAGIWRVI
jgi:hypothetical protein